MCEAAALYYSVLLCVSTNRRLILNIAKTLWQYVDSFRIFDPFFMAVTTVTICDPIELAPVSFDLTLFFFTHSTVFSVFSNRPHPKL